jgi:hypothetical protein
MIISALWSLGSPIKKEKGIIIFEMQYYSMYW